MNRQTTSDGKWFDLERATKYSENTRFDGSNHISVNTGSQWNHQALYCTAGGAWVVNHWSQYQGSDESWDRVTAEEAVAWLIANDHELPETLAREAQALEI